MPNTKSPSRRAPQAFSLQAVHDSNGLHFVIPQSVARSLKVNKAEAGTTVELYAAMIGNTLQLSTGRMEMTIPAITLDPASFIPESEAT